MTDTTQGQDAPNDSALFNEAVTATPDTLEKFENPTLPEPPKADPAPKGDEPPKPADRTDDNAPVPSGRFREEADARRKAERERDELQARLNAMQPPPQRQQQQRPPPQASDFLDDPRGVIHGELRPYLEQMDAHYAAKFEEMSKRFAITQHGAEKVNTAFDALARGMSRGDPTVKQAYDQIMASPDPYGSMVEWHQQIETMRAIGGNLEAYNKRIIEEALAKPEYRQRAIEAARGQAAASGNTVARPVVASSPSLGNVGAAGGDPSLIEPDDMTLFRQATQAKRR